jgi:hypothetical protein
MMVDFCIDGACRRQSMVNADVITWRERKPNVTTDVTVVEKRRAN